MCVQVHPSTSPSRTRTLMAASSHRRLAGPGGIRTSTKATAIAAPATAWPDGNEKPTTSTSGLGGRPRWKNGLGGRDDQLGRGPGDHPGRERTPAPPDQEPHRHDDAEGDRDRPAPRTLRNRARSVRTPLRMSSIQWNTERSNSPTNGSVVVGADDGGCRPTAAKTNTTAPSRTADQPIARRWFESTLVAAHAGVRLPRTASARAPPGPDGPARCAGRT